MTGQEIIDEALLNTGTNSTDYANAGTELNKVYQNVVDEIVVVTKGDYFWDIGRTNTAVNQSEYVAEKLGISPDDLDIKQINKVFIKYASTDTYYTRATYQNPATLDYHPDYYKTNQPKSSPFFYIQDTSFFIYPAPTEVVTKGIEIYVTHAPADIDETSTEADIEIPRQFHSVIARGLEVRIYKSQGKINESQVAMQEYIAEVKRMVSFMKQRYNQPTKKTISGLDNYRR